jgi:hypothetical protein
LRKEFRRVIRAHAALTVSARFHCVVFPEVCDSFSASPLALGIAGRVCVGVVGLCSSGWVAMGPALSEGGCLSRMSDNARPLFSFEPGLESRPKLDNTPPI